MQMVEEFFTQKSPLHIFATRRRVNEFYLSCKSGFLPHALSASEFFANVVFIREGKLIPKNIRKVFLLQIISKMQNLTNGLIFDKSFLGYLESSSFLFGFFNELALFDVRIEDIPLKDTYGDYEEHLAILSKIYSQYTQKLKSCGFYDKLGGQDYEILREFFKDISCVEFYLDGFLSAQERDILDKVSQIVPVNLHIECDEYNQSHFGFLNTDLALNTSYRIDKKTSEILSATPMNEIGEIEIFGFGSRLSQIALIFERLNEWLESGINPQKLAIITPDEGFCKYLELLDKNHNLNFAVGKSIQYSVFMQMLQNRLKEIKEVGIETQKDSFAWLKEQTQELLELSGDEDLRGIHQDIIFDYEKVSEEFLEFLPEEILELYILDLLQNRLNHTDGGKIKVMGVLESRGLNFERVVVVDFNDSFVPNLKDSDMFLNTKIRKALQIPTLKDKGDLQKHYYLQLFKNTKKIDIAFVDTQEDACSKMIEELGWIEKVQNGDEKYRVFPFEKSREFLKESFVGKIPSDFVFSASKINTFLTCKRKFYHQYIEKIKLPQEKNIITGQIIHEVLNEQYQKYISQDINIEIIEKIQQGFNSQIHLLQTPSTVDKLNLEYSILGLEDFWKSEKDRAKSGFRILATEESFDTRIGGYNFSGRIDRIDGVNDRVELIDYKFKTKLKVDDKEEMIEESSDYQLAVYLYGAKSLGYDKSNISAYLYDLKEGKMVEEKEDILNQKAGLLENKILKVFEDEIDFETTQERKNCRFCPFVDICGIEI